MFCTVCTILNGHHLANTIYSTFGQLGDAVIPVSLYVFLSPSLPGLSYSVFPFSSLDPAPWSSNLILIGRQVCQQLSHWWSLTAIMLVQKGCNCPTAGEGMNERKEGSDRSRGKRGAHSAYESEEEWSG